MGTTKAGPKPFSRAFLFEVFEFVGCFVHMTSERPYLTIKTSENLRYNSNPLDRNRKMDVSASRLPLFPRSCV